MLLIDLLAKIENLNVQKVEDDRGDQMYGYFVPAEDMYHLKIHLRDLAKLKKEGRP